MYVFVWTVNPPSPLVFHRFVVCDSFNFMQKCDALCNIIATPCWLLKKRDFFPQIGTLLHVFPPYIVNRSNHQSDEKWNPANQTLLALNENVTESCRETQSCGINLKCWYSQQHYCVLGKMLTYMRWHVKHWEPTCPCGLCISASIKYLFPYVPVLLHRSTNAKWIYLISINKK